MIANYNIAAMIRLMNLIKTDATIGLNAGEMKLFTNDITPGPNTVVADLTEATFTGYAAAALATWSPERVNASLQVVHTSPLASFAAASPFTVQEEVYGGWIEDAAGNYVMGFRFDNGPIPMGAVGDAFLVAVDHILGNPAGQGFCNNG